jgi:hypothetical protein
MSRDSSVDVVTKLRAERPWNHKCILVRGKRLSSSKNIGGTFPVIRRLRREAELPPSSAGCKMCAGIILCPRKTIMSRRTFAADLPFLVKK